MIISGRYKYLMNGFCIIMKRKARTSTCLWPEYSSVHSEANEKCPFNKFTPKDIRGGIEKKFLRAEKEDSWEDVIEHPEWDPSGASWEARLVSRSKWPSALWWLAGAFLRNKGREKIK